MTTVVQEGEDFISAIHYLILDESLVDKTINPETNFEDLKKAIEFLHLYDGVEFLALLDFEGWEIDCHDDGLYFYLFSDNLCSEYDISIRLDSVHNVRFVDEIVLPNVKQVKRTITDGQLLTRLCYVNHNDSRFNVAGIWTRYSTEDVDVYAGKIKDYLIKFVLSDNSVDSNLETNDEY